MRQTQDRHLQQQLANLESLLFQANQQLGQLRKGMGNKTVPLGKKILLGLGLAFLSASAVRYWMNKLEPVVIAYVEQHRPPTVEYPVIVIPDTYAHQPLPSSATYHDDRYKEATK